MHWWSACHSLDGANTTASLRARVCAPVYYSRFNWNGIMVTLRLPGRGAKCRAVSATIILEQFLRPSHEQSGP
jgi:hypothetical protein